jgi:hypothetical protein
VEVAAKLQNIAASLLPATTTTCLSCSVRILYCMACCCVHDLLPKSFICMSSAAPMNAAPGAVAQCLAVSKKACCEHLPLLCHAPQRELSSVGTNAGATHSLHVFIEQPPADTLLLGQGSHATRSLRFKSNQNWLYLYRACVPGGQPVPVHGPAHSKYRCTRRNESLRHQVMV